ncbi:MAG: sigma-54-dependent Fis family transcriptional regulator, partial [Fibrobacter sp.]|nr:sigma-54-dependent Fis family transcriptional regulator [Fibrobacter sp.]
KYLSSKGYHVKSASSLADARLLLMAESFDAVLLDLKLPDGCSLHLIKEIKLTTEYTAIIIISGISEISTAVESMRYGAFSFLTKPVEMDNIECTLKNSLEVEELRRREEMHKRLLPQISRPFFGMSTEIAKTLEYTRVAAVNDSVVLLLGETGTGKGVFARWIHDHSSRKNGNYVELNCSSLKGEILRSELYGHTKGAFTSAIKDRDGLIEIADGGTLFLDEIGDMDPEVQAELLKTIEERTFRRIGENRTRTSNFRLICATNRNLAEASGEGLFRSDLYYRICVFPIEIPSLRNRKKDIPGLVVNLLNTFGYDQFPLDVSLIEMLTQYSWPGNIRELRNMIERALLLAQGQPLSKEHFPGLHLTQQPESQMQEEIVWSLDALERKHIIKALKHFNDKNEASRALGISLSSLYRKIDSYKEFISV